MEVGAFEAKTKLSALLDQVEKGAEVTITRRGRPVARLVPATDEAARRRELRAAIDGLRELRESLRRRGVSVSVEEIKAWVEEGRV
jgi:prevent-host-death family protein